MKYTKALLLALILACAPARAQYRDATAPITGTYLDIRGTTAAPSLAPNNWMRCWLDISSTPTPKCSVSGNGWQSWFGSGGGGGGAVNSVFGRTGTVTSQFGDYQGSQIALAPAGNGITGTNVQLAIEQLAARTGSVSTVFGRTGPSVTQQTGDYTVSQVTGAAPLLSPSFTGSPSGPTPVAGDRSTRLATTDYVLTAMEDVPACDTCVTTNTDQTIFASKTMTLAGTGASPLNITRPTAGPGVVTTTNGSASVTGSGTNFTAFFNTGDTFTVNGETRTISTISSNTALTTTAAFATNCATCAYTVPARTILGTQQNGDLTVGGDMSVAGAASFSGAIALGANATATSPAPGDSDTSVPNTGWAQAEFLTQAEGDARYLELTDPNVVTFNGRSNAVTPQQADYDGFFLTPTEGNTAYAETATGNVFGGQNDFQIGGSDTIISRHGRDNSGAFQSLVELRTKQSMISSGNEVGRGAIRFLDTVNIPPRTTEIGYYQWGFGVFTDHLFEFWTPGVSITHGPSGSAGFLAVRDITDTKDIRLQHDGTEGIITTTGTAPGGIRLAGNGAVSLATTFGTVAEARTDGSFRIYDSAGANRIEFSHNGTQGIIQGATGAGGALRIGGGGALTLSSTFGTVLSLNNDGTAAFAGDATGVTASAGDNDTSFTTSAWVKALGYATLASPTLTGDPKAPTPAAADSDTSIPTTAWVQTETLNSTEADALFPTDAQADTAYVNATGNETIAGNKTFTNGVFAFGRSICEGCVTPITYSGSNFTAIGGSSPTWTVETGDQNTFRYAVTGKQMTIWFTLRTTSVTGTPSALRIAIPAGFTTGTGETIGRYVYSEDGTSFPAGELVVNASSTFLTLYKSGYSGTWATTTNQTRVEGTAVFEIQ